MVQKIFVALVVVVAVVVGLLSIMPMHSDMMSMRLPVFNEFFMATLPILGFGALIKYLCHCNCTSCAATCRSTCSCCKGSGCKCCGKDKVCTTNLR